ncbi:Lnb N-terminal periplasmic domain-containing protein [Photobacterium alginatilyticum]|uniref:DUF4105 domain-containing protein n=1 Tax=Photobacterium alginatilyticum TaxID=1775171 RepID=A0ABW9YD72_9GAMM|nr:DUF4105 domain-containing protein [Photobacterium alginatilyticum]NBI51213.1 DUF4105 domain-containing protein [Photobacterium alginatilyticum]
MFKHIITSALISSTLIPSAYAETSASNWVEQSQLLDLSNNRTWLKLMHYETSFGTSLESEVTSNNFFISSEGKINPKIELEATISAMLTDEPEDNKSAQCRFPARKLWLDQVLTGIADSMPQVNCSDYQEHAKEHSATSLSLLFATGYLGNPASMYGHLLIKLNNQESSELLENTLNYGAMVPKDENKLKYITWGILGGYQAKFSSEAFHRHSRIYNETELRDLWEYKLNLNQNEIDLVLAHHWELHDKTFTYYFFKQNCAYQIAKLLELVIDKPLMNTSKPWVMPYDIIAAASKPYGDNKDTVTSIRKHESRQEAFYSKFHQLSRSEQLLTHDIAEDINIIESNSYNDLNLTSKKRIVETLFDYYSYLEVSLGELNSEQKESRRKLLTERFALSTEQTNWLTTYTAPPHEAQYPSLLQVTPTYNSQNGEGLELRYRANYYDLLSLDAGRLPFSELSMFDLHALYRNDRLSLKRWDLFHVKNINVSSTGLPHDGGFSWSLKAGIADVDLQCNNCLVGGISGSLGQSYRINSHTAIYSTVDGKLQAPDRERGNFKAGISAGIVSRLTPSWRMSFATGYFYYLDNTEQHGHTVEWEQRFGRAKDWDIRTNLSYDGASEVSISYSHYW